MGRYEIALKKKPCKMEKKVEVPEEPYGALSCGPFGCSPVVIESREELEERFGRPGDAELDSYVMEQVGIGVFNSLAVMRVVRS